MIEGRLDALETAAAEACEQLKELSELCMQIVVGFKAICVEHMELAADFRALCGVLDKVGLSLISGPDLHAHPAPNTVSALLEDARRCTTLARSLARAMDGAGVQQFRAVSRAGQECVRAASNVPQKCMEKEDLEESSISGLVRQGVPGRRPRPPGGGEESASSSSPTFFAEDAPEKRPRDPASSCRAPGLGAEEVRLHGLRTRPDLNGRLGKLMHYTRNGERCHVILRSGEGICVRKANLQAVTEFELAEERPVRLGPIPEWLCRRTHLEDRGFPLQAVMRGGAIFVVGGFNSQRYLDSAHFFAPASLSWHSLPALSRPRANACSVVLRECLYILGGVDNTEVLSSAECFDPALERWTPLPDMSLQRSFAAVAAVGDDIYVCGGCTNFGASLSSLERFSLVTRRWMTLQSMGQPRTLARMMVVRDSLYVCGGCHTETHVSSTMEHFSPAMEAWTGALPMPWPCLFGAYAVHNDHLYLCGGSEGRLSLSTAARFNHATGRWKRLPSMDTARCGAAAAATPAGDVVVCGGGDNSKMAEVRLLTVECFRSSLGLWQQVQSMTGGHTHPGAMILGDYLYVLGGKDQNGMTDHAERLDLRCERWQELAPLPELSLATTYTALQPGE